MRTTRNTALAIAAAALGLVGAGTSSYAVDEGGDTAGFSAAASIDTSGRNGLLITADGAERSLRRVRLQYARGVSLNLPGRYEKRHRFASARLVGRDGTETTVRFDVPTGKLARRFSLVADGDSGLRAKVGRGSKPSITVYDFPSSTQRVEFGTVGAGTRAIDLASCRDERQVVKGELVVSRIDRPAETFDGGQTSVCNSTR